MELIEVSKKYSAEGACVDALKSISYSFPEKGLLVITGKSGCGKTTLLYVLAGLIECDEGIIRCENINLNEYSEMQWDDYRNEHIGIVFQDYQLLEDKTVEDNLRIVLDIRSNITDENGEINRVLSFVELEGYNKRKITELSGGQKQRVAIARAIIKNADVILADEPTGHLDEKNGQGIWEVLKNISEDRLVIVVTHDKLSADNYADIIVEMSDGEIINVMCKGDEQYKKEIAIAYNDKITMFSEYNVKSLFTYIYELCTRGIDNIMISCSKDNAKESDYNTVVCEERELITSKAKSISVKRSVSYAWDSVKKRKLRHLVAILMIAVTLFLGAMDISIYTFDYYDVMEKYIEEYSYPYVKLGIPTSYTDSFFDLYSDVIYSGGKVKKIIEESFIENGYAGIVRNQILNNESGLAVDGVNLIYANNLPNIEIKGRFPKTSGEIAITDYISRCMGFNENINSKVYLDGREFVITGIIKTDYIEYDILQKMLDGNVSDIGRYKYEMDYCVAVVSLAQKEEVVNELNILSLRATDFSKTKKLSLYMDMELTYGGKSAFDCSIIYGRDICSNDEVIVSQSMLEYLGYSIEELNADDTSFGKQEYEFIDLHNDLYNDFYSGYINFYDLFQNGIKIVGVFDELSSEGCPEVIVSDEKWNELKEMWSRDYFFTDYIVNTDMNNLSEFIAMMKDNNLYWEEPSVEEMHDIQKTIHKLLIFVLIIFAVISLMAVVILINCIGFSIKDSSHKIGIMRALGVRKRDTFNMFFWEICLILISSVIISLIMVLIFTGWTNRYFRSWHNENPYDILCINYWWIVLLYVFTFIAGIFILRIPLHKYSHKKPVELLNFSNE